MQKVFAVGGGCTQFRKPGSDIDYPELGLEAGTRAFQDAGLSPSDVSIALVGYCYAETTSGHRVVRELGCHGIPVIPTNSNCSTGSSAMYIARELLRSGAHDCALVLGFEKSQRQGLSHVYTDRSHPEDPHFDRMHVLHPTSAAPLDRPLYNKWTEDCTKLFACAAQEFSELAGTTDEHNALVAYKNHRMSVHNPNAMLRKAFSKQACSEGVVVPPLKRLQCAAMADGSAAVLLCNEKFLRHRPELEGRAVELLGMSLVTPLEPVEQAANCMELCGLGMARAAAQRAMEEAQVSADDVDVIELHDCYASAELMLYEPLGLCEAHTARALIEEGEWHQNKAGGELFKMGGRWVVNPSGGLLSKGHPIGATGIMQAFELMSQLRGEADKRQVDGAAVALQHNFGLGGAAVVTVYGRARSTSRL